MNIMSRKAAQIFQSKEFIKKAVRDLVDFLDNNIKDYGGWIPCAELY